MVTNNIATPTDFTGNLLSDSGITVVRTPITNTEDYRGDLIKTTGTAGVIIAFVNPKINQYTLDKQGFNKETTGYIMVGPDQEINKDDEITTIENTYRVINVRTRNNPFGNVNVYKFCEIQLIESSDRNYLYDENFEFITDNLGVPIQSI